MHRKTKSTEQKGNQLYEKKIFATGTSDKGLISKIYTEFIQHIKKIQLKNGKRTLFPRRHTSGQQVYEKMLDFTSYKRNASQNYNEIPPHTC